MERDIGAGWDYDEYNDGGDASFGASYPSESYTFQKRAGLLVLHEFRVVD